MKVYVASFEYNINPSWADGSNVIGVASTRVGAWRLCVENWREFKALNPSVTRWPKDEDDWFIDYHVEECELT